jgi:2-dehydropantoate 2-reductase
MKVTILGTGAMAGLFGVLLAPHADVRMLGSWQAALDAINRDGLKLVRTDGEDTVRLPATNRWEECTKSDLAIILVKSDQTSRTAELAARILALNGLAVTLQNGLGNLEIISTALGKERAIGGVTTMGATLLAPGVVRFGGDGITWLERHPRIQPLFDLFQRAGIPSGITDELLSLQWGKLVVNSAMNPLTACLHQPNGFLLSNENARKTFFDIARESAAIALANGIKLPYQNPVEMVIDVATRTAENRSSMLQDIENCRPTEIDAITLPILQAAKKAGIPAPLNEMMYRLIKSAEGSSIS